MSDNELRKNIVKFFEQHNHVDEYDCADALVQGNYIRREIIFECRAMIGENILKRHYFGAWIEVCQK